MSLCELDCEYKGYNKEKKKVECQCEVKSIQNFLENVNKIELLNQFKNIKKILNIDIIKCYETLFTKQGILFNIGNYIMSSLILISIIYSILFCYKGYNSFITEIKYLLNNVKNEAFFNINNTDLINSIKNKEKNKGKKSKAKFEKKNNSRNEMLQIQENNSINQNHFINSDNNDELNIKKRNKKKTKKKKIKNKKVKYNDNNNNNIENKIQLNDYELNTLSYDLALKNDNRSFLLYYLSLLRTKQTLIFTFYTSSDYNSRIIKIILFILSFSLFYTINALFFTDSTMHQIYIDRGVYNFVFQLPQIIYSTVISSIINFIISYLSLTEENIAKLRQEKKENKNNEIKQLIKSINIKYILFFLINFLLLGLFWFYLSTFCAVYKNTQMQLLKDTLISFSTSLVYPMLLNLIPGIFRIIALKAKNKNRNCLYKFSKIVQLI